MLAIVAAAVDFVACLTVAQLFNISVADMVEFVAQMLSQNCQILQHVAHFFDNFLLSVIGKLAVKIANNFL